MMGKRAKTFVGNNQSTLTWQAYQWASAKGIKTWTVKVKKLNDDKIQVTITED